MHVPKGTTDKGQRRAGPQEPVLRCILAIPPSADEWQVPALWLSNLLFKFGNLILQVSFPISLSQMAFS